MARILDTSVAADDVYYQGIQDLLGIEKTKAEIDVSPLFIDAESDVILRLPDAALQSPAVDGKGRTYEHRAEAALALQYLTVYNAICTQSDLYDPSHLLKSESKTVDTVELRQEFITQSIDDRGAWFRERADAILDRLDPTDADPFVVLTDSRLVESDVEASDSSGGLYGNR